MIYLDNAATTFPKPEVVYKRLDNANRNAFNSGRGSYSVARNASLIIDDVRMKILNLAKAKSGRVIFSGSATYALNEVIFGLDLKEGDNVYVSPFEHNSVIRPLNELKLSKKINIFQIPFKKETWELDENTLLNLFAQHKPKVILTSQISNATGYILPYEIIFELSKKYETINILDCSQGFGIIPIENIKCIDYLVFAGHKSLYANFGIGGYIKLNNIDQNHYVFGGTGSDTLNPNMEDNFEAGSPNIVCIEALQTSIQWLETVDIYNHEKKLTNYLIEELSKLNNCKLFIPDNKNIFGIVSFGIYEYKSEDVGLILNDEYDIAVRTGYHCAPLIHELIESQSFGGTVRVSIGYFNTKADIDVLISALKSL